MSKPTPFILLLVLALSIVVSLCEATENKLSIIASVRPLALAAKEIVGEKGEVTTLMESLADPHVFELRPSHVATIERADLLFVNGGGFEFWLPQRAASKAVPLIVEGDKGSREPGWVDPGTMREGIERLVTRLCTLRKEGCEEFKQRGDVLKREVASLGEHFRAESKAWRKHTFLSAHSVWGRLAAEYQLEQLGGIVECEERVSPAEFAKISKLVKEKGLTHIIVEPWMNESNYESLLMDLHLVPIKIDSIGSTAPSYREYLEDTLNRFRQVL